MISVIFFGTESFGVSQLAALCSSEKITVRAVVTQPPREVGRKQIITKSPVHVFAEEKSIPVLTPTSLKNDEIVSKLAEYGADIFVVAQYGLIIPKAVLELPKFGAVNVHGSLLPDYRGATPVPAAIANGDEKTGVTFIQMDELLDHGPILGLYDCPIDPSDTTESLLEKLGALGAAHLVTVLDEYIQGVRIPKEQSHDAATFTKLLSRTDGYIDPTEFSAIEIERMMRAYYPWPGVTVMCGDHTLKLIAGSIASEPKLEPGILFCDKKTVAIGTKQGTLVLNTLQLSGKPVYTAAQFSAGNTHLSGTLLTKITQS